MRGFLIKGLSALVALAFLFAPAQLAADADCGVADVYAWTSPYPGTTSTSFTACLGAIEGNNEPPSYAISLINSEWGLGWTEGDNYLGKNEAGGVQEIFDDPGTWGTSGDLWLKDPYTGSFVLALKGGNYFSMYYFEGIGTTYGFHYDMSGVRDTPTVPALSHASVYYEGSVVPEPATILLLGTGLLGIGVVGYRRRKNS